MGSGVQDNSPIGGRGPHPPCDVWKILEGRGRKTEPCLPKLGQAPGEEARLWSSPALRMAPAPLQAARHPGKQPSCLGPLWAAFQRGAVSPPPSSGLHVHICHSHCRAGLPRLLLGPAGRDGQQSCSLRGPATVGTQPDHRDTWSRHRPLEGHGHSEACDMGVCGTWTCVDHGSRVEDPPCCLQHETSSKPALPQRCQARAASPSSTVGQRQAEGEQGSQKAPVGQSPGLGTAGPWLKPESTGL